MKKFLLFLCILVGTISTISLAVEVSCPNAILIDNSSGRILYEKDAYAHVAPASTTKIMTAILVLEKGNLNDKVTASYNAIMSLPSDGSSAVIQVGEVLLVKDLLKGLLIPSGNDAANVLAEYIGGSIPNFVDLMNKKVSELGLTNTHFANPSGLSQENHYSCAYDLAIMYKYAFDNYEVFREIVSTTSFLMPATDKYSKEDRFFANTNKLIFPVSGDNQYYYEYCTGGKTGYTTEAKNCLVSSAQKDDISLICVVLGGAQNEKRQSEKYVDSIALYNYGFENIYKAVIINAGTVCGKTTVKGSLTGDVEVLATVGETFTFTLNTENTASDFKSNPVIFDSLEAPLKKGDKVGKLEYNIYGTIYSVDLVSDRDVTTATEVVKATGSIASSIIITILKTTLLASLIAAIIVLVNSVIRKKNFNRRLFNMRRYNARFRK